MGHAGGRATAIGAVLLLLVTGGPAGGPRGAEAAGESAFVGLTPCRLGDTRGNGFGGAFGPPALVTGVPRDFPVQGQCGIPGTAAAVSLNVTATGTQGPGFLLLYPQGGGQPLVSTLNYAGGETVANAALVPLGPGGLTVLAGVSGTDLILDVNGYFTDSLVHAVPTGNVFVGPGAGNLAVTGVRNIALGQSALGQVTSGSDNIAVGYLAAPDLTTGNDNIYIGNLIGANESATIRIGRFGHHTRTYVMGIRGAVTEVADAVPVMVSSVGQLGTVSSSRRVKTDIEPIGERSRGLHALRPVSFRYRVHPPDGPVEYGLIAEEVVEMYPELVVRDAEGAPETVRYHLLTALLLSELQRQERVLADRDRELQTQNERLQSHEARLSELAATIGELAAELVRLRDRIPVASGPPIRGR